jgi:hypothetical protein
MDKQVIEIHEAVFEPIADLSTWRAMPTHSLNHIDPFLFLNHHGPQRYEPGNNGLPFGPHPHRGFETLTFVIQGDITHKDSVSGESVINEGGIQWMTAGSGLIHSEVSSEEFKRKGGMEEVIQIWMNLPARLKMTKPNYTGLQKDKIPAIPFDNGKGTLNLTSGTFDGISGPVDSLTELFTSTIDMKKGAAFFHEMTEGSSVLLYVIDGFLGIDGSTAKKNQLVQMSIEGNAVSFEALEDSKILFCFGMPFNEPIVAQGPFVMNTQEEIYQAFSDYQSGKLGAI